MSDLPAPQTGNTSIAAAIQDRDGNTSSKRVAGFAALANAIAIAWYTMVTGKPPDPISVTAMWFFTFGCFAMTLPEWWGKPKVTT